MPRYTADDGTTIAWDQPEGPATIADPDGNAIQVPFAALAGVFDAATAALLGHLSAKDAAAHRWAHDLKGGLTALAAAAELAERHLARGDAAKAAEKAALIRELVRARVAVIEAGLKGVVEA